MDFLYFLSSHRSPFLDEVFLLATKFGEEILAMLLICTLLWCVNKSLAYTVGTSFFLSALAVQGLKVAFRVPRPWVLDPRFLPVSRGIKAATGYSFPSGHTQVATSIYGTIGLLAKKNWQRAVMLFLLFAVGFSRMYLGVHTPKDVVVSFLISISFSFATVHFIKKNEGRPSLNIAFSLCLGAGALALLGFALHLYSTHVLTVHYVSDCCKAAGAALGFAVGVYAEKTYINYDVHCDKAYHQALKVIFGVAGLLVLRVGLKLVLGTSLTADTLRYFLLILWVVAVWPVTFTKILKK
ncbi:MAG: phosphatase PAP2 family protein [Oscillospiraceae bacterium]